MKDKEDTNENLRDREKGMINLNFAGIRSREELYRYLQEKLNLPESRGENLDNIYAVLTEASGKIHIIVEGLSKAGKLSGRRFENTQGRGGGYRGFNHRGARTNRC